DQHDGEPEALALLARLVRRTARPERLHQLLRRDLPLERAGVRGPVERHHRPLHGGRVEAGSRRLDRGLRLEDVQAPAALDLEPAACCRHAVLQRKERLAALAADQHQLFSTASLSSPNAVCNARTASSEYFSSMMQEILISLVEMTRMLTPSSAS